MSKFGDYGIAYSRAGDRVELHPSLDRWMQGARYGIVEGVSPGTAMLLVRLDITQKVERIRPDDLRLINALRQ